MSYVDNLSAFFGGGWDEQLAALRAYVAAGVTASDVLAVADAYKQGTISAGEGGGGFTQEQIEDFVGALVKDTSSLDFTYDDATPGVSAVIKASAVTNAMLAGSIDLAKLATDPLDRDNHTGTQAASTISNFSEAVDDRVAALLVEGSGISIDYDDTANTLTLGAVGGSAFTVVAVSDDYTASAGEIVEATASSGNITITVPKAAHAVTIVKKVGGANTVTVVGESAAALDGGGSVSLAELYQARMFVGNGTTIAVIGERKPFDDVAALGGTPTEGTSNYVPRANHVHDIRITPTVVTTGGTSQSISAGGKDMAMSDIKLTSASCALTIGGFPSSVLAEQRVLLRQDTTGGRVVTYTDTIIWAEGYPPVIASGANAITEFVIYSTDGGTTLFGSHGQPVRKHSFYINAAMTSSTPGKLREYFEADARIVKVRMSVGDVPVTTAAVIDINLDGTTMYTTQGNRPSVAAAGHTAVATLPDVVTIPGGGTHYLTVDQDTASTAGFLSVDIWTVEAV